MEINDIQLRQFDLATDYQIVRDWWERRGEEPVQPCALTTMGVFATVRGDDIACAWLYLNNRSPVASMENVVINPECAKAQTAVAVLVDFFRQEAGKIGKLFEAAVPFAQSASDGVPALVDERGDVFVDRFEAELIKHDEVDLPLTHRFTPGLYIREIYLPAGTLLTSKIHKTEHPYVISRGDISVWTREAGARRFLAPYTGITKPGTRRILYAHDDTIWTTFHATTETDVDKIEADIIEPRRNPLILKEAV